VVQEGLQLGALGFQSITAGSRPPASSRFSATVMPGHQREVLVDHADAELARATVGEAMACSRPSISTAAAVGRW
jgi:hypothetical protein